MNAFDTSNTIFISWIGFHGRSQGIADELGIECHYVNEPAGNLLARYARNWKKTRALLAFSTADNVIVMMPPTPALLASSFTRKRSRGLIVGDLHTGVFTDPKWKPFLALTLRTLRRRGAAIVTNETLARRVRSAGVSAVVLHDMTETWEPDLDSAYDDTTLDAKTASPFLLTPLAYAHDEPLDELLSAALLSPELNFIWTGRAPESVQESAPANVLFSGFTTKDDFYRLLSRCAGVMAITTEEDTMQRAGYEALNMRKPLVTSDMRVLREYFGDAALYASPSKEALSAAASLVTQSSEKLTNSMAQLHAEKLLVQESALDELRDLLG